MAATDTPEVPEQGAPPVETPPAQQAPAAAETPSTPPAETPAEPPFVVAEYIGESPRLYQFPGAPMTLRQGDICGVPYMPADGFWKAAPGAVITRLPDNHPTRQPVDQIRDGDPKLMATSLEERDQILRGLGITTSEQEG